MTVDEALALARARGVDRLDAQLLLAHASGRPRTWLLAHGDAPLDAPAAASAQAAIDRRAAGVPLAYLTGLKEFHGLTLRVDARVLVPRPETEALVDWALEILRSELAPASRPRVVDLGTGSGAIALAVKHAHPAAEVHGVDLSDDALDIARANAARLGLDAHWHAGSWWQPLAGQRFDLALANPPYVASGDPHLAALGHEPRGALTPGPVGLEALEAIVDGAAQHLTPTGWILLEHGYDQAGPVAGLMRRQGLQAVSGRRDLAGLARCTGARR
jgi:release factor glutamine methyltransferase